MTADDYAQAAATIAVWRADGLRPWSCLEQVTLQRVQPWRRDLVDWWEVAEAIAEERRHARAMLATEKRMAA